MAAANAPVILNLEAQQAAHFKLQPAQHYTVRRPSPKGRSVELQVPDNLIVTRQGNDLHIRYADGSSITLDDFYTYCRNASVCTINLAGDSEAGFTLSADVANSGLATSDGAIVVYAHGDHTVLMSMANGDAGLMNTFSALSDGTICTYIAPNAALTEATLVPLIGMAALAGNSGPAGGVANLVSSVIGVIQAGPVIASNDLEVTVYAADGTTILANHVAVSSTGQFTSNLGAYSGVVIVKLVNKGAGADYLDEATGTDKDLTVVLVSAGVINAPGETITLNLNAITTIAFNKLGADHSAAHVEAVNLAVANAFGLSQLQTTGVIATNSGSYNPADGLSDGEKYGAALAALSGVDKLNGGNLQTTLDQLTGGLSIVGSAGTLSDAAKYQVTAGAKTVAMLPANTGLGAQFAPEVAMQINYRPISEVQALVDAVSAVIGGAAGGTPPTREQLQLLGITGVTIDNLAAIQQAIEASANDGSGVSTIDLLQGIVTAAANAFATALAVISSAAENNSATSTTPSLSDYVATNVTGVNAGNLAAINSALDSAAVNGLATDTRAEVLAIVDAFNAILASADGTGANSATPLTGAQYTLVGVTGLTGTATPGNTLALLNNAVDASAVTGANTTSKLQALADAATHVIAAAGNPTAATGVSLTDLTALGITGVSGLSAGNLLNIQNALAGTSSNGTAVDTLAEIQALVNAAVDLTPPGAPVTNTVAGDDSINLAESGTIITGSNEAGANVVLTVGGIARTAIVSGTSWSYTLQAADLTAMGQGPQTLSVTQTDAASNTSVAGTHSITVDTVAPTLSISSDVSAVKTGQTATITFTFSEDPGASFVWDGSSGDVGVGGGTLSAISGSGLTRTATFTPTAGLASGSASITVASGTYTDAVGNSGGAGTMPSISIDTLAPTLAISSNVATLKAGETATITFTFSEDPGSSFVWDGSTGDVVVGGGTLGAISGSGLTRTATFTPTAGLASGSASITVASGTYTDAAGNSGGAGTTPSISIDTLAPATPSINAVTGDDFINLAESGAGFVISGTGEVGATVSLVLGSGIALAGGNSAVVDFNGNWSVAVAANDVTAFGLGTELISASQTDAAGNTSGSPSTRTISVNALALTLAITDDKTGTLNAAGGDITYTFTFSTAVTGFAASDVTVTNGTKGAFSGSGTTYTLVVTPNAGLEGDVTVDVAGGVAVDGASNPNSAAVQNLQAVDTLAPTLAISSNVAALKAGETATVTFSFSEDPGASFVWDGSSGDVVVGGGTLGAISGSGLTRIATFTPTAGLASGSATITVASGTYTDAVGNSGGAGTTPSISIDTLAPTLAITSNVATLKSGETATITFTFSEDPASSFVWDGSTGDVIVSGGTLGAISGSGLIRTATLTPTAGLASGSASITVASGTYTDAAGNTGGAGTTPSISIDTLAPTLAITSDVIALRAGQTAAITFTFSEDPGSSFVWDGGTGDVVVSGGTLGAISGSGLSRTATFTPTAGLASGIASITVAAGTYTDAAGNNGGAGTTPSISIDTLAPVLAITSNVATLKSGETATITFTFSEDPGASFIWDGSSGDVVVSGGTLGAISGSGLTRTATFTPTAGLASGSASITVASGTYSDAAGNSGGAGTTPSISIDTLAPPAPTIHAVTGDDFINLAEAGTGFVITGTGEVGASVSLVLGSGITLAGGNSAVVASNGNWSITVAASDVTAFGLGSETISASQTDVAGNTSASTATRTISVNALALTLAITDDKAGTLNAAGGDITYSFTFSAAVTGFAASDITVGNGTKGAFSGSGTTYTLVVTPNAGLEGNVTVDVAGAVALDLASNPNSAAAQNVQAVDTLAPNLNITSDVIALRAGQTAAITFTFSEDPGSSFVWDGGTGDVVVSGGTLGAISGSGLTRTATFSPTAGLASGIASITVAAGTYTDAAGNNGSAGTTPSISIDTLAPTLAITSDVAALKAGETATVTFSFSEDPGASIVWDGSSGDVVVGGGTLGAISGSGLTRTATFTPTAGLASGSASITVANGTYTDAAGNTGAAGTTPSISIDTLAPTLAITSDVSALMSGETATITFNFSEDPGASFIWDGSSGDVVVSGGTLGAISGSGLTRTATFTPTSGLASGSASITVASGTYSDAAGNSGGACTTPSISIDTLAPTLAITSNVAALKSVETATITFTFSEDPGSSFVWDGSSGDVVVSGGTLGAISGSGLTRTATFTPTAGLASGSASITVASGTYSDAAGNSGGAGTTPSISIDTLAPTLAITSSVATLKSGETATITFTFSEDPGASFAWNGSTGDVVVSGGTLSAISGSGLTRTATFTPTAGLASGIASITVAAGTYTDAAGNNGSAGTTPSISIDTLAPTLAITSNVAALKSGEAASITFTFSEDPGTSFTWNGNSGDVMVGGGTLSAISGSGLTRTATFTPTAELASGSATITVASGTYFDDAGNNGGMGTTPSISIDTLVPTLAISSNVATLKAGETATIAFTFSEDPASSFVWDGSTGDVVVSGGTLSAISGSGLTRTATFTPTAGLASGSATIAVASGAYTDASGNTGGAGTTPSISIDTLAPTATLTAGTYTNVGSATVQSSELGTAYLVDSSLGVTNLASITGANGNRWNSVAIATANSDTSLALTGLVDGSYVLYTVDAASNLSTASSNLVTIGAPPPTVTGLSLASATGIQNNTLNAGDVVSATVTFSEAVTVSGGPQLALHIGSDIVQASYASGSGGTTLTYNYTILANQTDANGISIDTNPLGLNSGTILSTASSTAATLTHAAVADNGSFLVDTTAPSATATTATLLATDSTSVQSSEVGTAYLVDGTVTVTNLASITTAADAQWNSVNIATANSPTNLSLAGLGQGTYKLYTVDAGGNLSAASASGVTVMPSVIDLPSVQSLTASKLIAPVKVGGNLYYFWDLSGNSTADASDYLPDHNTLDVIFNESSTGAALTGDTTDTQRYATIGGLRLALPSLTNLSAIRTATGLPAGWRDDYYWSASSTSGDYHSVESISSGGSYADYDNTLDGYFGNGVPYLVALQVLGIAGPAVPTLALATDSGSSNSDGITNIATVNLGALVAHTSWQYQVDGGAWTTGIGSTFTLSGGTHTYAAHQTDQSGNVGFDSATVTYTLDTAAPTATIADTTVGTVNSGYAHFTFTFNEPVVGFTAADITVSNGALGTLTGSGASYAMDITPVMGSGNMTVAITTGSFTDVAGNVNSVATASVVQPYNMLSQAGQAVIDLGASGKLIAPIEVEGKWYYFWDRNGDGNTTNDLTTNDVLDPIFNHDINGVTNTTVTNADGLYGTTDVYRYATINGVQVALPTLGATYPGTATWMPGTNASGTGPTSNATYNDLLAIWDALNGTTTGTNIAAPPPSGWQNSSYCSATAAGNGHAYMAFVNGLVNTGLDNGNSGSSYVALQVL